MTHFFHYSYVCRISLQVFHGGMRAKNAKQVIRAYAKLARDGEVKVEMMPNSACN